MNLSKWFFLSLSIFLCSCNDQKKESDSMNASEKVEQSEETKEVAIIKEKFLIKGKAAGEFKIGASIPTSLKDYSITREQQVRTTEEGPTDETIIKVTKGNEKFLEILPSMDPITGESTEDIGEIRITSELYKTAEGIGVGSSLDEFVRAYPDHKLWFTYVSNRYIVEADEVEAQFLLEGTDFIGEKKITSEMTPLKKEDFREGSKIRMIRIY